jgi:hypothetical protein
MPSSPLILLMLVLAGAFAWRVKRFSLASLLVVLTVACLMLGVYAYSRDAAPKPPAFFRDQRLVLQIVTAPTRSVIGGLEYDEAETTVHSTHEVTIPASGKGLFIQSVVDGTPIEIRFSSAEKAEDGKAVRLNGLHVFLPMQVRIAKNSREMAIGFGLGDVIVRQDFHGLSKNGVREVLTIRYTGEGLPHTFVRMRIDPEFRPVPVLDVTAAHAGK